MIKRKKSYYLVSNFVKRLSGFTFYRLSIYHRNKRVCDIGYLDITTNVLFINFSLLYYYVYKGFDFISFTGLIGTKFRDASLSSVLIFGLFSWLFYSKKSKHLIIPKKFWASYLGRSLYIIYYLLFRNLLLLSGSKVVLVANLAKILSKRFLVIKNLGLL